MRRKLRIIAARVAVAALAAGAAPLLRAAILAPAADMIGPLVQRMFDPDGAWCLWLGLGLIAGSVFHSRGRRLEEQARGRLGGPSFSYMRWEARLIRLAISFPIVRTAIGDHDQDLVDLDRVLVEIHGFPPLPTTSFDDATLIPLTDEYLRRVLPHLSRQHLAQARLAATDFVEDLRAAGPSEGRCSGCSPVAGPPMASPSEVSAGRETV